MHWCIQHAGSTTAHLVDLTHGARSSLCGRFDFSWIEPAPADVRRCKRCEKAGAKL